MTFLKFLWSKKYTIAFVFLILSYFTIGIFQINNTGLAGDESAHFAAAHSYITGQGLNVEHPTLLKDLDALVLKVFFKEYQSIDNEQWSRGVNYLIYSSNDPYQVLHTLRLVHLVFNAILLLWLILYTFKWKFLKAEFSVFFGFLYVFSPSFFSHNFLLTFDVAGSVTAFCCVLSFAYFISKFDQLNTLQVFNKSLICGLILALTLNSKFSNFVILIILALVFGVGFINYYLKQNDKKLIQIALSIFSISTIVTTIIWILNTFAFWDSYRWSPDLITLSINILFGPFFFYLKGLVMTSGRSAHIQPNFIDDHYQPIKYYEFISRIFWFKENPFLIVFLAIAFCLAIIWLVKKFFKMQKNGFRINPLAGGKKLELILTSNLQIIVLISFPLIYLSQALNSQLTIGYRHFYPVLIFIYAGIAFIITNSVNFHFKNKQKEKYNLNFYKTFLVGTLLIGYIVFGVMAQNQGISYVNFLWSKQKWNLITDSTINWDQEQIYAVKYLKDNNLFKSSLAEPLDGSKWNTTFDISGGPNSYLVFSELTGNRTKLIDFWSVFSNLRDTKISKIDKQYLVVDTNTLQNLSDEWYKNKNPIAKENLDFLINNKPIYQRNEIVFIYQLGA